MRTLSTWPAVSLAAVALLSGCGSSSSSSTSSGTASTSGSSATTASTPATGSTATGTPTTSTRTTGSPATSPTAAAAVESCKQGAKTIPTRALRSKIEAICEKASSGKAEAIRAAAREVCEEIIKASPVPEGTAKQHALAGCSKGASKDPVETGG